mgnify:CR=1 FL=1
MKILGIGNAIVDVLCKVDDEFLIKNSLTKRSISFIVLLVREFLIKNSSSTLQSLSLIHISEPTRH